VSETATLLAGEGFADVLLRLWVIGFLFPLRFLVAADPIEMHSNELTAAGEAPYGTGTGAHVRHPQLLHHKIGSAGGYR